MPIQNAQTIVCNRTHLRSRFRTLQHSSADLIATRELSQSSFSARLEFTATVTVSHRDLASTQSALAEIMPVGVSATMVSTLTRQKCCYGSYKLSTWLTPVGLAQYQVKTARLAMVMMPMA